MSDSDVDILEEFSQLTKEELVHKCHQLQLQNWKYEKEIDNLSAVKSKRKAHKERPFDFNKYRQNRVALKFLYLGWSYQGLAAQDTTNNTIEEEIFAALLKAKLIENRQSCNYSRCGRTDKGVSAFGQVIALDIRSKFTLTEDCDPNNELQYAKILNRILPPEIRILTVANVSKEFDARFSCETRVYKYFFPARGLNLDLMREAARKLVGEHDFRNFCKVDVGNNVNHFVRRVVQFEIRHVGNFAGETFCEMEIEGLAFLWHQVRCMAAILLLVARGVEKPDIVDQLLDVETFTGRPQYEMASDVPLVLYGCRYKDILWNYDNSWNGGNIEHLQMLWTGFAVRSTMTASMINGLHQKNNTQDLQVKEKPISLNVDDVVKANDALSTSFSSFRFVLPSFHGDEKYRKVANRQMCKGVDHHFEKQAAKKKKLEERYSQKNQQEIPKT